MGTGGPSALISPTCYPDNCQSNCLSQMTSQLSVISAIAFEVDVFRLRNTSIAQTCTKLHIRMLCAIREQWPIFPVRRQTSIFGTAELNFRVRNGNGWTLCVNITHFGSWQVCTQFHHRGMNFKLLLSRPDSGCRLCLLVHLQGFEPGTHWLRVSCSTNWAKGA